MQNLPEFIQGLGQWKAGAGSVVTEWHNTKEAALAEFIRLVSGHDNNCSYHCDQNHWECSCKV